MSSRQLLRITRPTKLELIRLRRRLAVARRIHRILRDRLTLIVQEFFIVVKKLYRMRRELNELLELAYRGYSQAYAFYGHRELSLLSNPLATGVEVYAATRNIVGVRAPLIELKSYPKEHSIILPPETLTIYRVRARVLELLVSIAELEKELQVLGIEFERTKRRVNMLEHVLIPRILNTIKYLRSKFEEREREEKTRMKRIKTVLTRRRGVAIL
ncbi:MAG TPA: V-type ATP synthase subunit D [Ignisphaera sp.]|nr:V-type ATP synthase subunit D [Ignisphaera sp.]